MAFAAGGSHVRHLPLHFIFVQAGYDLVQRIPGLPALVRIPLIACGAFAASWLTVWLMQRWRVTRRFVE